MLLGDFFEIIQLDFPEPETILARIRINGKHRIFGGHFPGFPVVPGVCMIQIIKEILVFHCKVRLFLSAGDNIKFLRLIDPGMNETVMVQIRTKEQDSVFLKTEAMIYDNDNSFLKFKGIFLKLT